MIDKIFGSIRGNFIRRTTNPFLGTLLVVWIVRNWEFVYSLFNFDNYYTLDDKLEYIGLYFQEYNLLDASLTILITFSVIILTYVLLNTSLLIANFFEKKVKPYILMLTDKNSIVPYENYQALQQELEEARVKADDEKSKRLNLRREVDDLEKRIVELQKVNNEFINNVEAPDKNEYPDDDELLAINEVLEVKNNIEKNNFADDYFSSIKNILKTKRLKKHFLQIAGDILNGNSIDKSTARNFAIYELIEPHPNRTTQNNSIGYYQLTELGYKTYRSLLNEDHGVDK